jgi:UDP-N-acetyl-D-glucosamine dehydrogenase
LDIIHLLREKGATVAYHDPHVASIRLEGDRLRGVTNLDAALATHDCVIVATDHSSYDWQAIKKGSRLIIDTRNAIRA